MVAIKVDVKVDVNVDGNADVKVDGPSSNAAAGTPSQESPAQPTPHAGPFDVGILNLDGTGYWMVRGHTLGAPTPIAEADARDRAIINTMLTNDLKAFHEPYDPSPVRLLGTFFINLSAFKRRDQ